jgi:4-amino-4-deoxy-L-arabinose transferase-like glycosyltransferase
MWPVIVALITLLALALRWYYVSTAMVINPIRADASQYYTYAWNLAHHGIFSSSTPGSTTVIADSYRDPGYPLLLAIWMKVFHTPDLWYAVVLLTQALLGALTVPLAMQLGRRWLGWRWVAGAGLLMAVWPHNIVIASDLLSETLFGFLCALAMWLCARACNHRSAGNAIAAGLAFGAAALTNAILIPFGVLLGLYFAWRRLVPRRVWLALCIGAAVLPGAWTIRNHYLPPQTSGQSSADRALQNLVQGSWPTYHAAYAMLMHGDQRGAPIFHAIDTEYQLLRRTPTAGARVILHRLGSHPWHYMAWYTLTKPSVLWDWDIRVGQNDIYTYPTILSPFDTQPVMRALEAVCHTINPLLAALALASLIVTLVRSRRGRRDVTTQRAALHATLLLLVYITLLYSILQTDPRYSIAFRSFEMLLAMTTCSLFAEWFSRMRGARSEPLPGEA